MDKSSYTKKTTFGVTAVVATGGADVGTGGGDDDDDKTCIYSVLDNCIQVFLGMA